MVVSMESYEIARVVANEIQVAFRSLPGSHWEKVDGEERAVRTAVFSPTLQGKSPRDFGIDGEYAGAIVQASDRSYRDSAGYTRAISILGSLHVTVEVVDGVCTGTVTAWEKSFDYD